MIFIQDLLKEIATVRAPHGCSTLPLPRTGVRQGLDGQQHLCRDCCGWPAIAVGWLVLSVGWLLLLVFSLLVLLKIRERSL